MIWLRSELVHRLRDAYQQREKLGAQEADWKKRWYERTGDEVPHALMAEHSDGNWTQRTIALNGAIAHLTVLLSLQEFNENPAITYEEGCKPAFAMTYGEVQALLAEWLVDVMAYPSAASMLFDSQRLLLGWCAQLLVVPNSPGLQPLYADEFFDAARSIYAYAVSSEIAQSPGRPKGRNAYDAWLMLALAAFPFLEGVVRRRLPDYLEPTGEVRQEFTVLDRFQYYRVESGRRPNLCSNISHDLHKLEEIYGDSDLGRRLTGLRQEVREQRVEPETRIVSGEDNDLYSIIYKHRNSNLHGGRHVVHVGLAALLLATIIGLDEIRDKYDEYSDTFRDVAASHSPIDPNGLWPHIVFYPVGFPNTQDPENVHCWRRWQRG
jgi:hypothetical protein